MKKISKVPTITGFQAKSTSTLSLEELKNSMEDFTQKVWGPKSTNRMEFISSERLKPYP